METTHRLSVNGTLFLLLLFLLAGCAGAPGKIKVGVSPFDGAQETALDPACAGSDSSGQPCSFRLGLFTRSTMAPGSLILVVVADASNPIAEGDSLYFIMNGRVVPFTSIDRKTKYPIGKGPHTTGAAFCGSSPCSVKRYLVTRSFLKEVIDAPRVTVRVQLKNGLLEGTLSDGEKDLALPSFREFYAREFVR
jgi:hypothetical protein